MQTIGAIWNNLMNRFKQDDLARIFEIEQRLSVVCQGTKDVSSYYTDLITLWETYNSFVEFSICICGKCECIAAANWKKMLDRSRIMKFLMGFSEAYESTKRQVLMLKPLPSIEEVFNMVCQDERQRILKPVSNPENVIFQASHQNLDQGLQHIVAYTNYKPRPRPICTHCGMTSNVVNKCYKLNGYPPGHPYAKKALFPTPNQKPLNGSLCILIRSLILSLSNGNLTPTLTIRRMLLLMWLMRLTWVLLLLPMEFHAIIWI